MNYIEYTDVAARYRVFDTSSFSNAASDFIYYAEKEVESALSAAYSVPFSDSHPTVKDLCIDMCYVRYLRMNRPKDAKTLNDMLYERIGKIINGDEPIMTDSGAMLPSMSDPDLPESTTEDYHPVHTMLGAENEYTRISPDRLDALEDIRD